MEKGHKHAIPSKKKEKLKHYMIKNCSIPKKKVLCSLIAILLLIVVWPYFGIRCSAQPKVQEGDVIFHTSTSQQSPLISFATGCPLTHCGIIVMKGDTPYVLEASNTLKLTPLDDFINQGKGGVYWLKHRPKQWDASKRIRYKHLLGRKYDLAFSFHNNRYYCSELVYDIYLYQQGIKLCEPKPMKSYNTLGLKRKMRQRGMNPNDLVVAPSDLFKSDKLR